MFGRFSLGEFGGNSSITISENIDIFVMFPRMENLADVQVMTIVGLLGQVHDKVRLEVDFFVLVLHPDVEHLVIATWGENGSLVQMWREEHVFASQSNFVFQERIIMEITCTKHNCINLSCSTIRKVNSFSIDMGENGPFFNC